MRRNQNDNQHSNTVQNTNYYQKAQNGNNKCLSNQQNQIEKSPYQTNPIYMLRQRKTQQNFRKSASPMYYNLERKQQVTRQFSKNIQNHYKQVHLNLRKEQEKKKANFRSKVTRSIKKKCDQNSIPVPNSLLSKHYLNDQIQKERRAETQMNFWYKERISQLQEYNAQYLQNLKKGIESMLWNGQIHHHQISKKEDDQNQCQQQNQEMDEKIQLFLERMNLLYQKGMTQIKRCID